VQRKFTLNAPIL